MGLRAVYHVIGLECIQDLYVQRSEKGSPLELVGGDCSIGEQADGFRVSQDRRISSRTLLGGGLYRHLFAGPHLFQCGDFALHFAYDRNR